MFVAACRIHFDAVDTGTTRFCDELEPPVGFTTLFCRDFDDGSDPLANWDEVDVTSVGSLQGDDREFATAPVSLHTRLGTNPPMCSYARAHVVLPTTVTRAILIMDVRLGGSDTDLTAPNSFVNIEIPLSTGNDCQLIFWATGSSASVHEQIAGGSDAFYPMSIWPADQTWTRFRAELDWADRGLDVSLDGVSAYASRLLLRPGCLDSSSAAIRVWYGHHCETGGGPREARFDNLAVFGL
jgi:hypothetical protein